MDDLPEESLERYPPGWAGYDWAEGYDQDDFDNWVSCLSRRLAKHNCRKRLI